MTNADADEPASAAAGENTPATRPISTLEARRG